MSRRMLAALGGCCLLIACITVSSAANADTSIVTDWQVGKTQNGLDDPVMEAVALYKSSSGYQMQLSMTCTPNVNVSGVTSPVVDIEGLIDNKPRDTPLNFEITVNRDNGYRTIGYRWKIDGGPVYEALGNKNKGADDYQYANVVHVAFMNEKLMDKIQRPRFADASFPESPFATSMKGFPDMLIDGKKLLLEFPILTLGKEVFTVDLQNPSIQILLGPCLLDKHGHPR